MPPTKIHYINARQEHLNLTFLKISSEVIVQNNSNKALIIVAVRGEDYIALMHLKVLVVFQV